MSVSGAWLVPSLAPWSLFPLCPPLLLPLHFHHPAPLTLSPTLRCRDAADSWVHLKIRQEKIGAIIIRIEEIAFSLISFGLFFKITVV